MYSDQLRRAWTAGEAKPTIFHESFRNGIKGAGVCAQQQHQATPEQQTGKQHHLIAADRILI